ncbi:short chain dehydrogenase [Terasakiella pusilla]|uniref:short chain dehydrogenase n=1 Tax=Terasakiella pusilla TaxID=64973 RepID=UPI003AA893DA
MKIAIFGAPGTIGQHVVKALQADHEVISIGQTRGDFQVDLTDIQSIREIFDKIGHVDAVINTAGAASFNNFMDMTQEEWQVGINSKMMGQINLTRVAADYLTDNGSITLTTGILSDIPIKLGVSASTTNGAVEKFVMAVATELPRGLRINVVSPTVLTESLPDYGPYFPGFNAIDGQDVAPYYVRSVLGVETGKVLKCFAGT